jgi:hypothetical protein
MVFEAAPYPSQLGLQMWHNMMAYDILYRKVHDLYPSRELLTPICGAVPDVIR